MSGNSLIEEIVAKAHSEWAGWFGSPPPNGLEFAVLRGGAAHSDRAILALFPDTAANPAVVLKIALSDREASYLHTEHQNLTSLLDLGSSRIPALGIPRPLAWMEMGRPRVLATSAVPGRRVLHPHLIEGESPIARRTASHFFEKTFAWSAQLKNLSQQRAEGDARQQASYVREFTGKFVPEGASTERFLSYADYIESWNVGAWRRVWQHGATDMTNALVHRRKIRFVDWEHASPMAEPWFDVAYSVLATVRMAIRQSGGRYDADLLTSVLDPDAWLGRILRQQIERAWKFPIPISDAVVLTAIATSLRRERAELPKSARYVFWMLTDQRVRAELNWLAPRW